MANGITGTNINDNGENYIYINIEKQYYATLSLNMNYVNINV